MKSNQALLVAAMSVVSPLSFASCGASSCSINTNWTTESAATATGTLFDLRYEYIDQSQPRAGSTKVAVGQVRRHHDEVSTEGQNLVASASRMFASGWGYSVVVPIAARDHRHIHNHQGVQVPASWRFAEAGDVRVIGRVQTPVSSVDLSAPATAGFTFGLKLPTGRTTVSSASGVAERSLQPGTGTTDAILGGYFHQALPKLGFTWFAQGQYQRPLNNHAGYRPGASVGVDFGISKEVRAGLNALLQLNLVHKQRDNGAAAEPADTGGRSVFLSPGLSYAINDNVQLYGFYQQPLFQSVNGVQLTVRRAVVLGITGRL